MNGVACVSAWSIFETRSVKVLHKLLGVNIIPADLLRTCRHLYFMVQGGKTNTGCPKRNVACFSNFVEKRSVTKLKIRLCIK